LQYEQLVQNLAAWSYVAVFLAVLLEGVGLPLPSLTFALVMAALAGQGQLNFWLVYILTVAGGIIGGVLGYWIGLKGGRKLVEKYGRFLFITPERFTRAEALSQKHGTKAIFFGRYLPAICVWGSNLSGIARLPFGRFFIANLLGMLLWSTTQLTLGYVGGRSFETLVQLMNGFVLLVVGGLIIGGIAIYYYNRRRTQSRLQVPPITVRVEEEEAA